MTPLRKCAFRLAIVACLPFLAGCGLSQVQLPADAKDCSTNSLTPAEFDTWFESGHASLDGAVKPADSVHFIDQPNCSFYKWSEQMFLWLTSPAPPRYGSGDRIMNTSAFFDVSLPDANGNRTFVRHRDGLIRAFNLRTAQRGPLDLPVVLERRTLRILELMPSVPGPTGKPLVLDASGAEVEVGGVRRGRDGRPTLLDPSGRPIESPRAILHSRSGKEPRLFERRMERFAAFDSTELVQKFQFGRDFVLLDLFGHFTETEQGQADGGVLMAQNGSLVYYAITVNNVFALFRTMQGAAVPAGTRFPLTQSDLDAVTTFASAHGQPAVIDPQALAIEIKTSWVEASGLTDANKFIQMKAVVPTYDTSNPNDWAPNGTKTVTLAMVGMHVVGSTGSTNPINSNHGHPEMLWSTFEHVSNDPDAAYSYLKSPSGTGSVPQNTAGSWVFCASGATAPFNEMRMAMGGASGDHIVPIDASHTIGPTNMLRAMPWGLDGTNAGGNSEVISINNVVRSHLDPADLRRNYFHEGTTWTIFGGAPGATNQVGTNRLENTTMESFNQGGNCFDCHITNTTAVSHVFNETAPLF